MRLLFWAPAAAVGLAILAGAAAAPMTGSTGATGTLDLNATLHLASSIGGCEAVGLADECAARMIDGPFRGLGEVSGTYSYLVNYGQPFCGSDNLVGNAIAYPIRITVAGKGEIHVAVAEAPCVLNELNRISEQTQAFTVTGGTGVYVGASGSGTLERTLGGATSTGRIGNERWNGTLSVPGLAFDLSPPTFTGAADKTVKTKKGSKTVRVSYRVSATDDRDGAVPVTCVPRSGTRLGLGRTRVTCEATDRSANTATTKFTVWVKAARR